MDRVRLNLGDLKVETFQPAAAPQVEAARGRFDTSSCNSNCERSHCISGPCCELF